MDGLTALQYCFERHLVPGKFRLIDLKDGLVLRQEFPVLANKNHGLFRLVIRTHIRDHERRRDDEREKGAGERLVPFLPCDHELPAVVVSVHFEQTGSGLACPQSWPGRP